MLEYTSYNAGELGKKRRDEPIHKFVEEMKFPER